jgi:hypothetical protein
MDYIWIIYGLFKENPLNNTGVSIQFHRRMARPEQEK